MNPMRYDRGGGGERIERGGERGERGDNRGERGERDRGDRRRRERKDNSGGGGPGGVALKQRRDRDKDKKNEGPKGMPMMSTPVILGAKPVHLSKNSSSFDPQKEATSGKSGEVIKIINENFEFQADAVARLLQSDYDDFTVVSVVGSQGVGKSSILNQLAGLNNEGMPQFAIETYENQIQSVHQTGGVDLCVIPSDRLILLDSQPALSPSILMNATKLTDLPSSVDVASHENLLYLQTLQMVIFLLTVSHVVVVVQESVPDLTLWRLFRSAVMLKYNIPDVSYIPLDNEQPFEYTADPVVVFNKLREDDYLDFHESSTVLLSSLEKFFITPKNGKIGEIEQTSENNPVPYFLLPMSDDECNIMPSFQQASDNFRQHILSFPKKNFAKPIAEKDWGKNANKIWEIVKKSATIHEYNKTLQKMQLFKT